MPNLQQEDNKKIIQIFFEGNKEIIFYLFRYYRYKTKK